MTTFSTSETGFNVVTCVGDTTGAIVVASGATGGMTFTRGLTMTSAVSATGTLTQTGATCVTGALTLTGAVCVTGAQNYTGIVSITNTFAMTSSPRWAVSALVSAVAVSAVTVSHKIRILGPGSEVLYLLATSVAG